MGAEARTRLTIWLVVAAAVLGFAQTIRGQGYVGPALLAVLLASAAVAGIRRLGGGAIASTLAAAFGFFWYIALVFRAPLTAWTMPTPTALREVWSVVVEAYSHSLVDYAPVPLREGYAVMIVAAAWMATVVAELTTFRWKRPLIAVALPSVMFCFAMLVGTGEGSPLLVVLFLGAVFAFWASESSHRLRSWGAWVEPGASAGGLARRLGASCLAAAFFAPLFLPAIGDGIVAWRTGSGEGRSGGSAGNGASLNPWVSIVPRLIQQSDQEMFRVQAPQGAYWRTTSLEIFDGVAWRDENPGRLPAPDGAILGERDVPPADAERDTVIQELSVTGLRGHALPAALTPTQAFRMTPSGPDAAGVHYDPQSAAVEVARGLEEGDVYRITSRVPRVTFEQLQDASPPAGRFELISAYKGAPMRQARTFPVRPGSSRDVSLPDVYYQLPGVLSPEVVALTRRWTRNRETPLDKLVEIQRRLRSFDYTLNPEQTRDHDHLRRFLLETRAGYCQQFATAFAAMARILDYPARVSVGFLPGAQDLATGAFVVRGTDAHAWPEVYFEGVGWIAFEPTPRDAYATPAYTAPSPRSVSAGPNEGGGRAGRVSADPGRAGGLARGGVGPDGRPLPPTDGSRGGRDDAESKAWQGYFSALVATLGLALVLALIVTPLGKEARDRRRYARAHDESARAQAAFIELQRHGRDLADRRLPHESARAYLRRLASTGGIDAAAAARLASLYETASYSPDPPPEGMALEARRLVRDLRAQLWSAASWWARGTHVFSPRGLTK